jgi:hypothetical protein
MENLTKKGYVRFVVEKYEDGGKKKFEIHFTEAFCSEFVCNKFFMPDWIQEEISNSCPEDILEDVLKSYIDGWYEIVGEFWYDSWTGFNGEVDEFDSCWDIRGAQIQPLQKAQWEVFVPPPAPPPHVEPEWEHATVDAHDGRYSHQCPQCKRWCHRCSNCDYMDWRESTWCSELCWKAAGAPLDQETYRPLDKRETGV